MRDFWANCASTSGAPFERPRILNWPKPFTLETGLEPSTIKNSYMSQQDHRSQVIRTFHNVDGKPGGTALARKILKSSSCPLAPRSGERAGTAEAELAIARQLNGTVDRTAAHIE